MAIGGQKNYGLTDNLVSTVLNVVDKNNQRVDRLDEISARTKTSYIKKAGADLASRHGEIRKQQKQHKSKYGVTPIHPVYKNASTVAGDDDSPWSEKQKRKLRNRITGIKRASENIERVDSNVEESSSSVSESKAKKDKKSFASEPNTVRVNPEGDDKNSAVQAQEAIKNTLLNLAAKHTYYEQRYLNDAENVVRMLAERKLANIGLGPIVIAKDLCFLGAGGVFERVRDGEEQIIEISSATKGAYVTQAMQDADDYAAELKLRNSKKHQKDIARRLKNRTKGIQRAMKEGVSTNKKIWYDTSKLKNHHFDQLDAHNNNVNGGEPDKYAYGENHGRHEAHIGVAVGDDATHRLMKKVGAKRLKEGVEDKQIDEAKSRCPCCDCSSKHSVNECKCGPNCKGCDCNSVTESQTLAGDGAQFMDEALAAAVFNDIRMLSSEDFRKKYNASKSEMRKRVSHTEQAESDEQLTEEQIVLHEMNMPKPNPKHQGIHNIFKKTVRQRQYGSPHLYVHDLHGSEIARNASHKAHASHHRTMVDYHQDMSDKHDDEAHNSHDPDIRTFHEKKADDHLTLAMQHTKDARMHERISKSIKEEVEQNNVPQSLAVDSRRGYYRGRRI